METTKVFVDGLRFERPKEGAPEFVKGRIGIEVAKLKAWLETHEASANKGWLNADLLQSKDGQKLYFQLNTWKPATDVSEKPAYPTPGVNGEPNPDDIPF